MTTRHTLFLRISAWSLIITSITTLVAHLVIFDAPGFDDKILLYQNWGYILRNDIIIIHCLLVIVSMLGLGLLEVRKNPGWIGIGFLCFTVFGLAEIARMTTTNIVVNGLRETYSKSNNDFTQNAIRHFLEITWPEIGTALFMIFILAFSLGCIFYGIAFLNHRWVGKIFLIWGIVNLFAFANSFLFLSWLDSFISMFSFTYQPAARLLIGVWFLKEIKGSTGNSTAT